MSDLVQADAELNQEVKLLENLEHKVGKLSF